MSVRGAVGGAVRGWRVRHPIMLGVIEGTLALGVVAFALGLSGPAASVPAWPVLIWAALAFHRPLRYQLVTALVLGFGIDFLSGSAFGSSLGALAGALAVANLFDAPIEDRWSGGHAVFVLAALGGGWLTSVALAIASPSAFGPVPGLGPLLASLGVIALAVFGGVLLHVARERRRMRELAGGGIGGARTRGLFAGSFARVGGARR